MILRYIFTTSEPDQTDELIDRLLAAVGEESKEDVMTAADQLMERGKQKGIEQGIQQGRRETLLDLLRDRFGELPDAAVARVAAADLAALRTWTLRVLTAPGLDDVFAGS